MLSNWTVPSGLKTSVSVCVFVTLVAALSLSGCGGSSKPPSVSVTASAATVDGNDTVTLTATVTNDKTTSGTSDGVTWSVSGGGTLSGSTTSSATYTAPGATALAQTITVTATSVADTAKTGNVTLTIPAMPAVTPPSSTQLTGTVGSAYSLQLTETGGIAPYTWTLTSGTLPTGWTLTPGGLLSGPAPVAGLAGPIDFTFKVTDSGTPTALTATEPVVVTIAPAPAITFTGGTMPATATYESSSPYVGFATATGGAGSLTYKVTGGSLPLGMTLISSSNGEVGGTPTAVGTYNFTMTASDAFGDSATQSYKITVSYPALVVTPATLPVGYVGSNYTQTTLTATGGSGTGYSFAPASGSSLPAGLTLSTGGMIGGKPTGTPGTTNFTVTVTDSASNAANGSLSITIDAGLVVTPATLPVGYVGSQFTQTSLAATGGSGTGYNWTLANGTNLPAGLSLSAGGVISGKPTGTPGPTNFTAAVTDSAGNTASGAFTITVDAGISINPVTGTTLAEAYANSSYTSVPLTASGGNGSYTWSVVAGSAPPAWMSLSSTTGASITLTGTPTAAANAASFGLMVTDTAGNSATVSYSITVGTGIGINPVTGTQLTAYAGSLYTSPTLTAAGGNGNYTWSVASGSSLPGWLSLSSTTTASTTLTGTPSAVASSINFTLKVADTAGNSQTVTYSITVNAGISITPATGTTLPEAYAGSLYNSGTINVTGGNGSYSWGLTNSPAWMGLSPMAGATGSLIGTPGAAASQAAFTLKVSDTAGNSQTVTYYVTVGAGIQITPPAMPAFYPGAAYPSTIFTASGGAGGPFTWSWAAATGSTLPSGLSINQTTGAITGTPANATSSSVTSNLIVTAKDSAGNTLTTSISITIEATLTVTTSGTLNSAVKGVAYALQLQATGGTGGTVATGGTGTATPYVWSISASDANNLSTTLGLSLSSTGLLSGTPSAAGGPVTFTPTVSDGTHTATPAAPLSISATAFSITTATLTPSFAVDGNSYVSGNITVSGGTAPYTYSISSGSLPTGLSLNSNSTGIFTVAGIVSVSATTGAYNFKITIVDHTGLSTTSPQYTLTVYSQPAQTPNPNPLPSPVAVNQPYTASTITATGGSGNYNWAVSGTYANSGLIVNQYQNYLSISGTPIIPGTYGIYVTLTDITTSVSTAQIDYTIVVNPTVPTGQAVSGTLTYAGSQTGWVYLALTPNNCNNGCNQITGTAVDARTANALKNGVNYTIKGVPSSQAYTLTAWMDNIGYGARNAANPVFNGATNGVVVNSSAVTANVTLADPSAVNLGTATPTWDTNNGWGAFSGGAVISFDPICTDGNACRNGGVEMPSSYNLEYSTDPTFNSGFTNKHFPANGGNSSWIVTGLTNGQTYYFRAAGWVGSTSGAYSAIQPSGGLLIGAPSTGSQLSGTVTFTLPTGVSAGGKTLYAGCYDANTATIYADPIASPVSPQAYSVYVPNGTNCQVFGFIDLANAGLIGGPGEISNTNNGIGMIAVTVNGAMPNQNITVPSGNSVAVVKTETNSGGASYGAGFQVYGEYKLPVAVELATETPDVTGTVADVVLPADIATGGFSGNEDTFDLWPQVTGTPVVGDSYSFNVTYSDGTSETLTAAVSGVLSAFATNLSPTGGGISTTPNFSWDYPSNASNYLFQFQLQNNNGNTIWEIPPQHGSSNGFASTISPYITWDVDPTNTGDLPDSSYLSGGNLLGSTAYNWSIEAYDSYGNEAQTQASFTTTASNLALTINGKGFGPALASYPFTGSINASGGSGTYTTWTVNGTSITATSLGSAGSFSSNDGLLAYISGSTLYFVGTPTVPESSLPLSVTVTDNVSNTVTENFNLVVSSGPGATGVNNALLSGTYACKFNGYFDSDGSRYASLTSFVANGSGGITSGVWDANSRDFATAYGGTIASTSSYSVGADNTGVMTMHTTQTVGGSQTNTNTYAIALNDANGATTTATEFRMVEIDDVGTSPSGQHGDGICYQATTPFTSAASASYSYGLQGEVWSSASAAIPMAIVGRYDTNSTTLTISNDEYDVASAGVDTNSTSAGSYVAPDATGRILSTTQPTGATYYNHYVTYIVDSNRMFILETDPIGWGTHWLQLLAGDVRKQQQSANTAAALLGGSSVIYGQAYANSNGANVYQITGSSTGTYTDTLTINASLDDSGGTYTTGGENGETVAVTLDSANSGRATFSPGSGKSSFLYFFNTGSAFYLNSNTNGKLTIGWLEAQTQPSAPPFANANIAGSYLMGELPRQNSADNDNAGEIALNGSGGVAGSGTLANAGILLWDQPFSATGATGYSWLSTTYGAFSVSQNGTATSCIDVTPVKSGATGKMVCIENTSGSGHVLIFEQ